MAASDHSLNIVQFLEGEGIDDISPTPPTRIDLQNHTFVMIAGGRPPDSFMAGTDQLKYVSMTAMTISPVGHPAEGESKARSIWDALSDAEPTGYLRIEMRQPAPVYAGTDGQDRARWNVNFMAWIQE